LSGIKKLAGQTVWYGASTIFSRLLNYLLTPYLTYKLSGYRYGEMSLVYAAIPFLNSLFLYGMETAYFRYIQKDEHKHQIYSTIIVSLLTTTIFFTALMVLFRSEIASFIRLRDRPSYILISAFIIAFDTMSALPFAKLRQEGRPRKYAFIRIAGIFIYIGTVYFFLSVCPALLRKNPYSVVHLIYDAEFGVGYILLAGLFQSFFQFIVLQKGLFRIQWKFNFSLWKEIMIYSLPLTVAGFAGVINETFDRIMLGWWAPVTTEKAALFEVGTYSASYKLSILITLFIQAFRLGAEPFFFRTSVREDAPRTYARVMKFFVITVTLIFLIVALYLDIWKLFIQNRKMWVGLKVVPILLFANMFLGIYINLSIWYRLSHKTTPGAYITLVGAAITLLINYLFIPHFSYLACAWATFFCYGSMMVISYFWGQKVYPIPYAVKKLLAYMAIVAMLYFLHHFIAGFWDRTWFSISLAVFLTGLYVFFLVQVERKEFQKLPLIGKYL
jgi:O-antigen/teichoic acid export membrane protein